MKVTSEGKLIENHARKELERFWDLKRTNPAGIVGYQAPAKTNIVASLGKNAKFFAFCVLVIV